VKAILTYHSIDDTGSPVSVPPATWAAHARWLSSGRVRVLGLDELVAHPDDAAGEEDAVAVTFDDGFLNVGQAVETLQSNGVPATIFIVSGHVGGTNAWGGRDQPGIPTLPLLGWTDLERLVRAGASVQAHTRAHPALTTISAGALDDELQGSREDLHARLGVDSTHVAYPYGDLDDDVVAHASRWYRFGYTTRFHALASTDHSMRLPRLDMYYFRVPGALEAWGSPAFGARLLWVQARRAIRARFKPF
jgi:peptidoglycan/xylan/chitin deacetylase (PgdA/CDA1 family)